MEKIMDIMSVQEFAELMTKNVPMGQNKIYAMVREPGFPSIKIGSRYYVLTDKVNEWLEKKAAQEEVKPE
ncbi:MAG: helix-turn-helix domain-containing protein [Clostridia bacterium]|nr:helix-turn-helix domain-containing protein [Clostridia bacterium]